MNRQPHSTSGLVQLVIRRPQEGQAADSEFFTTWETMERADWRGDMACQLLQIARSRHFGFFPFAQEFHVESKVGGARSIASANKQHGSGGGEKLYIPKAQHAKALVPVGPLIPIPDDGDDPLDPPKPSGFIKTLIERELSAGGLLLTSDRARLADGRAQRRFWFQEPLHLVELGQLERPPNIRFFEERDMHGDSSGFVTDDGSQVIVAPPAPQCGSTKRSWFGRMFGG